MEKREERLKRYIKQDLVEQIMFRTKNERDAICKEQFFFSNIACGLDFNASLS